MGGFTGASAAGLAGDLGLLVAGLPLLDNGIAALRAIQFISTTE